MKRERVVHICVRIPPRCDADDVAVFAMDALTSWGGQLHIDDPLFESLSIKSIHTSTKQYRIDEAGRDFVEEGSK